MKIIFVIPNLAHGGAERVISILSNSFVEKECDVDVVLLQDIQVSYQLSNKVNLIHFGKNLLTCKKKLAYNILRNYFKKQKRMYEKVVVIPFLDTCLKRTLLSVVGLNLPVIASERNDPYQKGSSIIARIKSNIPYMLASHCVFQTEDARDYYCSIVRKKSDVILNPLVMPNDVCWNGYESKRIVTVGRLEPQKNHSLLVDAFGFIHSEYPDYKLEIYGEGSLRESLQLQINSLGLANYVTLCGYTSDVFQILQDSLLFVMPSDYEGLSNALIEALAVGIPTISTDHPCGGARMVLKNGMNGVLIPVKDKNALVQAMKTIIENRQFAAMISENGYKIRERLSVQRIIHKWMDVIGRL